MSVDCSEIRNLTAGRLRALVSGDVNGLWPFRPKRALARALSRKLWFAGLWVCSDTADLPRIASVHAAFPVSLLLVLGFSGCMLLMHAFGKNGEEEKCRESIPGFKSSRL